MRLLCKRYWFILLCLWLVLLSTACLQGQEPESTSDTPQPSAPTSQTDIISDEDTDDPSDQDQETSAAITTLQTPSPEPVATQGPPTPSISASRQVLGDDGQLTVDQVVAVQDGWIVVYADERGRKGEVLGYTSVGEGTSEDVSVTVDPLMAGEALYIVFHEDRGEIGTFEFPDHDRPLEIDQLPVEDQIRIDNRATVPELAVSDQEVLEDGIITIDLVAATKPGWLALHHDDGGQPGQMAAYAPIQSGTNQDLALAVNWREATSQFHAVLYEDLGEVGHFEDASIDLPVRLDGVQITTVFEAFFPPDVHVVNQPVIDGGVKIERAVSYGPGWLVIYFDDEGGIGNIIGQAPLDDGINEQIVVPIVESAATPLLHIMLHNDTSEMGQFEFPIADPMITHEGIVPLPITFRTDAGNYLITRDQPLSSDDTVEVPLIVVEEDAWIVIYGDQEGEPGEMLGRTWIPAGLHRDTVVKIDPELATGKLHAVLHVDAGTPKEFEYPDSYDVPFRRNSSVIDAPITILPE